MHKIGIFLKCDFYKDKQETDRTVRLCPLLRKVVTKTIVIQFAHGSPCQGLKNTHLSPKFSKVNN